MKTLKPRWAAQPFLYVAGVVLIVFCFSPDARSETAIGGGYFSGLASQDSYATRAAPLSEPLFLKATSGGRSGSNSPLPSWTFEARDPSPYGAGPVGNPAHRSQYCPSVRERQTIGNATRTPYTSRHTAGTIGYHETPLGGTVASNLVANRTSTNRVTAAGHARYQSPAMPHMARPAAEYARPAAGYGQAIEARPPQGEVEYQRIPVRVGPDAQLLDAHSDIPGPLMGRMIPAEEDPFAAGPALGPSNYGTTPRRAAPEPMILHPAAGSLISAKPNSLVYMVQPGDQMMKMSVHGSRHLRMTQRMPQVEVDNPDVLTLTILSPNEVRAVAKAPGVAHITLWGEDGRVSTVNVLILGDVTMLTYLLKSQFPNSQLSIIAVGDAVAIRGYVEKPEDVDFIVQVAEQYYPTVINQMEVSGVQQILLQVKVMEVSRTKLRQLGFDFSKVTNGNFVTSSVGDALRYALNSGLGGDLKGFEQSLTSGNSTFSFAIRGADSQTFFWGMLNALREDKLGKVLAEPSIVARSGRPSYFEVGGQFPFVGAIDNNGVAQIEWKNWGTRVDFLAICLGNGRIRLEVRPIVSERDDAAGIITQGFLVPALKTRSVDTGVELNAGQTLAIGGLIQERIEAQHRGIPWISTLPYIGALFRSVKNQTNEVELIITVTPYLIEPMNPDEVPACMPGQSTTNPTDCELFFGGHLEVPNCTPSHGPDQSCVQCQGSISGAVIPETPAGGSVETVVFPRVRPLPVLPEGNLPGGSTPGMMSIPEPVRAPAPDESTRYMLIGDDERETASSHVSPPGRAEEGVAPSGTPVRLPPPLVAVPRPRGPVARPNNPYARSRVNMNYPVSEQPGTSGSPGFIGPVGYDVLNY